MYTSHLEANCKILQRLEAYGLAECVVIVRAAVGSNTTTSNGGQYHTLRHAIHTEQDL